MRLQKSSQNIRAIKSKKNSPHKKNKSPITLNDSINYFKKLYHISTNGKKGCQSISNLNLTIVNSSQSSKFSSPKFLTTKNSPRRKEDSPLPNKVISFVETISVLQKAISNHSTDVKKLKKKFEIDKQNLIKSAINAIGVNKKSQKLSTLSTSSTIDLKYKSCDFLPLDLPNMRNKKNSFTQTDKVNKRVGIKDCYDILKNIFITILQREKEYSPNFNYVDNENYDDIHYSICYESDSDIGKYFGICQKLEDKILNLLSSLIDNFEEIKQNYLTKINKVTEENKKLKKECSEFKKCIIDYLSSVEKSNTSLYNSNDIIKIFKKSFRKCSKSPDYEKDIRSYKLMYETYKHALDDSQKQIHKLKNEIRQNSNTKAKVQNGGENDDLFLDQIKSLKDEIKENKTKIKLLEDNNKSIIAPIANAIEKIIMEININQKIKDYFFIIFKIIGYTDEQINNVYLLKEKKNKKF